MNRLLVTMHQQWTRSKLLTLAVLAISTLCVVFLYFEVVILQNIIVAASNREATIALQFMVIYLLIIGGNIALKPLQKFFVGKIELKNMYIISLIVKKIARVSYDLFDHEEIVQLVERVKKEPDRKLTELFNNLVVLLSEILSIFVVVFVAREAGVAFMLLLVVLIVVIFLLMSKIRRLTIGNYISREELTRKETYLNSLFFDRSISLERKNYDFHDFIGKKLIDEVNYTNEKMEKNIFKVHLSTWLFENSSNMFVVLIYLLLLLPISNGKTDVSLLIALIPVMKRISSYFMVIVNNRLPLLFEHNKFLNDMNEVMNLPELYFSQDHNNISEGINTIEFRNVSYKYPNGVNVINGLNLELSNKKSYALVGENGCGKSTLIKLMIGLYKPTKGEIYYNNIPSKEFTFEDKMNFFGVVFQDYAKFEFSVLENIVLNEDNDIDDRVKLVSKLANVDKDITGLKNGYETQPGKLFDDGEDFSIGQWQKLSVARMLYNKKDVYIFDEPTASLDPISESEMYCNYIEQIKNLGLSLFVTHRLGATTIVDEILVMSEGKIIEQGSHEDLMMQETLYKEMYIKQRGLYI